MNLFENIKSINELIEKNVELFQFLVEQLNSDFRGKNNLLTVKEFIFKPELFQEIAQFLDLNFENENASNVCFANDKDLRSEFKDNFSAEDVLNFVKAVFLNTNDNLVLLCSSVHHLLTENKKQEIQKIFWVLVERGALLSKN